MLDGYFAANKRLYLNNNITTKLAIFYIYLRKIKFL